MSSRRSSISRDSTGPSKRQKVYRACLACVNSKTRCEDVVRRKGCLRCRDKRKSCSLVQAETEPTVGGSHTSGAVEDRRILAMEDGWNLLQQRMDRLEQNMYARPTMPDTISNSNIVTPSSIAPSRPLEIHKLFTTLYWHSVPITERIFTLASDGGYPDPVARGLVTLEQMEMAFHLYVDACHR